MEATKTLNEKKNAKRKRSKPPYDSISYLTGDIGLNIDHFNKRFGSYDPGKTSIGSESTGEGNGESHSGEALAEAKRYVRRYFIRPQNIFCSNKAEILKALIDLGNEDCSVYTLNNLGDDKDTSKLMNSDIIYYYDDGILYDKNKVKVMDYDLSIKHEENRKQITNANRSAHKKEFKDVYSDRLTTATDFEENFFNLDFDDCCTLTESKEQFCCICGEPLAGYGNNPEPFMSAEEGRCCDGCNLKFVIPARLN